MRRAGMFAAVASCVALALGTAYAYEALQGPTELRYWDQTRAYDGAQMDAVVEIDMAGNVVWEWWFSDHVVQDIDPAKPNYIGAGRTIADYPRRLNLNLPGRPVRRDWLHCNSLDYNAELDQVVINSVQGEFYVIDHGNTFIAGDPDGSFDGIGRGGLERAPYFEWGGRNDDHTWALDTRRSGWPAPIQDVLVANGVAVVFHGHDHLFAKQELDHDGDGKTDLTYLACPRPSYRGYDTVHPEEGGYVSGDFLGNSGHLRVKVSPAEATIEYVRAYAPEDETEERVNGQASYSFSLTAGRLPSVALIPAGEFEMGDHHDLGGLEHGNDEVPLHVVSIDAFQIGTTEIGTDQVRLAQVRPTQICCSQVCAKEIRTTEVGATQFRAAQICQREVVYLAQEQGVQFNPLFKDGCPRGRSQRLTTVVAVPGIGEDGFQAKWALPNLSHRRTLPNVGTRCTGSTRRQHSFLASFSP